MTMKYRYTPEQRFGGATSAEEKEALAAMLKLQKKSGSKEANRIAAMVTCEAREKTFAAMHGVKLASSHCIQRLLGKRCRANLPGGCKCHPQLNEHGRLWLKDGKPHVWTSEPYHIGHEDLKDAVAFAEANNLDVEITAEHSFHYPGRTFAMIYKVRE